MGRRTSAWVPVMKARPRSRVHLSLREISCDGCGSSWARSSGAFMNQVSVVLIFYCCASSFAGVFQDAAANLVQLDRFEQGAEVAFAKDLVALPLYDLEEDGADDVLAKNLQQQFALRFTALAVDEDAQAAQLVQVFAMAGQAAIHQFIIGLDGVLEGDAGVAHLLDRVVDIVRAQGDVLDAFAVVLVEVFGDLRFVVGRFVDGNADLAAGRSHRLGFEARVLAGDVEVTDLAEVEQAFIKVRQFLHAAPVDVVGQVVDIGQAIADRIRIGAGNGHEVDVVDADVADAALGRVGILAAPAVDEIQQESPTLLMAGMFNSIGPVLLSKP